MVHKFSFKSKWIKTDPWRGYNQPIYAVAGSSDTGTYPDSPAPTPIVRRELRELSKYLKSKGISTRERVAQSSNVFMRKRWLVVPKEQFKQAKKETTKWLSKNQLTTNYIHEAD